MGKVEFELLRFLSISSMTMKQFSGYTFNEHLTSNSIIQRTSLYSSLVVATSSPLKPGDELQFNLGTAEFWSSTRASESRDLYMFYRKYKIRYARLF